MYSGSPRRKLSSSPGISRKDITKASDDKRKRDDTRNQTGRESYKQSDRHSSRSYYRHDDHNRRDRYVDDYDRGYSKSSYRFSRDSRYNINSDYSRSEKEHRSRDYVNDVVTQSHAKSDGSGYRSRDKDTYDRADSDRRQMIEGDRYGRTDYRKSSGHSFKESSLRESKEVDVYDEKRRHEDRGSYKEQGHRERKDCSDDTSNKGQDSVGKKPNIFGMDSTGPGPDGTESAIDAAKIAALKAAELVTKNIAGTGCMSTHQKKKLLWANKKNIATEEVRGFLLNYGVYYATRAALGLTYEWSSAIAFITRFVTLFALVIAITKDLPDVEGDSYLISTLATKLGVRNIALLGSGLLLNKLHCFCFGSNSLHASGLTSSIL
ncbi:hypothetical protein OROMI_028452 [Orobanche minor]